MKKLLLSIDGGGCRGIIPLYFLKFLEEDLVKITGKTVYETFDMFYGTSVGALIIGSLIYSTGPKTIDAIIKDVLNDAAFIKIFSTKYNVIPCNN